MNDDQLDPEQEERVRDLLADLGTAPDSALPPEVAARLDETLSGLVAEREGPDESTSATVVPLRRRWAPRAAAAAAAVIVAGAGGVAAANLGLFGGPTTSSDQATSGSGGARSESLAGGDSGTAAPSVPGAAPNGAAARLPHVSAASFDSDVTRLVQRSPALDDSLASDRKAQRNLEAAKPSDVSCPGPKLGDGSTTNPVLYDDTLVALVFHPAQDGRQLVEAWTCTGDHALDRTRITLPHETSGKDSPGNPGLGSPAPTP